MKFPFNVVSDLFTVANDSNDAVLPIDKSYPGCPQNAEGLCSFDTVLSALRQRVKEIDFDYDCFGN